MGKFGGFGGGMGNMQQLMKQAQKMQQDMLAVQNELSETEVTGTSGGAMVEVTVTADKSAVTAIKIDPQAIDPDDVEMLEDMLTAAFNDAFAAADKLKEEKMAPFGGGLGL